MPKWRSSWYFGTIAPLFVVIAAMTVLVSYSPTLYRMFCAATGLAGTTQRATVAPEPSGAATDSREITVQFDANVGNGLDWDFRPSQGSVEVKLGVATRVTFVAHNRSNKTLVGRAVYNVTPYQAGPFFYKIQCFCFTNEKLGPGETAVMPVLFFIDKAYATDPTARLFDELTLSYTFYPKNDLTPEAIRQARDLATGSKLEDAAIHQNGKQAFDNDAPRR